MTKRDDKHLGRVTGINIVDPELRQELDRREQDKAARVQKTIESLQDEDSLVAAAREHIKEIAYGGAHNNPMSQTLARLQLAINDPFNDFMKEQIKRLHEEPDYPPGALYDALINWLAGALRGIHNDDMPQEDRRAFIETATGHFYGALQDVYDKQYDEMKDGARSRVAEWLAGKDKH